MGAEQFCDECILIWFGSWNFLCNFSRFILSKDNPCFFQKWRNFYSGTCCIMFMVLHDGSDGGSIYESDMVSSLFWNW